MHREESQKEQFYKRERKLICYSALTIMGFEMEKLNKSDSNCCTLSKKALPVFCHFYSKLTSGRNRKKQFNISSPTRYPYMYNLQSEKNTGHST